MKGRRPNHEELELWGKVAKNTDPLPSALQRQVTEERPLSAEPVPIARDPVFVEPFSIAPKLRKPQHQLTPSIATQIASQSVAMDKKAFRRLKQGRLKPEAKLDLHGMTLDRAHGALNRFVMRSHASGLRLVLVVTGKGKHRDDGGPIPTQLGVLRHQVPEWLRMPPLGPVVLQVAQAHQSHGGGGAYYVYLRRAG